MIWLIILDRICCGAVCLITATFVVPPSPSTACGVRPHALSYVLRARDQPIPVKYCTASKPRARIVSQTASNELDNHEK